MAAVWDAKLAELSKEELLHIVQNCVTEAEIRRNLQGAVRLQRKIRLTCYECLALTRKLL